MPGQRRNALAVGWVSLALVLSACATQYPTVEAGFRGYFAREAGLNLAHTISGVTVVATGVALVVDDDPTGRSAGYALLAAGAVQAAVGLAYYVLREDEYDALQAGEGTARPGFAATEERRVGTVIGTFPAIQIGEMVAIFTGLGLLFAGVTVDDPILTGVGAGLSTAASAIFAIDAGALQAAEDYHRVLTRGQ